MLLYEGETDGSVGGTEGNVGGTEGNVGGTEGNVGGTEGSVPLGEESLAVQLDDPLLLEDDSGAEELPGEKEELSDDDSPPLGKSLPDDSGPSLVRDESLPTSLLDDVTAELATPLDGPSLVEASPLPEGVADSLENRLTEDDEVGGTLLLGNSISLLEGKLDESTSLDTDGLLLEMVADESTSLDDATLLDSLGDETPLPEESTDSESLDDGSADVLGTRELSETPLPESDPEPDDELSVSADEVSPELLVGSHDDDESLGVKSLLLDVAVLDEELVPSLVEVDGALESPDDEAGELLGMSELALPLDEESVSEESDELLGEDCDDWLLDGTSLESDMLDEDGSDEALGSPLDDEPLLGDKLPDWLLVDSLELLDVSLLDWLLPD